MVAPCSVPSSSSLMGVGGDITLSILQRLLRGYSSVRLACPLDYSTVHFHCCERIGIFFVVADLNHLMDRRLRIEAEHSRKSRWNTHYQTRIVQKRRRPWLYSSSYIRSPCFTLLILCPTPCPLDTICFRRGFAPSSSSASFV
jgi:hypothetical protein